MEVTPQHLREVELREVRRGYDPDVVDDLLEHAAAAMDALREQARVAADRASRAEDALAQAAESEEALRRALLLAQRAADLSVEEARARAASLVAEAEERAREIDRAAQERARSGASEPAPGFLEVLRGALEADITSVEFRLARMRETVRSTADRGVEEEHAADREERGLAGPG